MADGNNLFIALDAPLAGSDRRLEPNETSPIDLFKENWPETGAWHLIAVKHKSSTGDAVQKWLLDNRPPDWLPYDGRKLSKECKGMDDSEKKAVENKIKKAAGVVVTHADKLEDCTYVVRGLSARISEGSIAGATIISTSDDVDISNLFPEIKFNRILSLFTSAMSSEEAQNLLNERKNYFIGGAMEQKNNDENNLNIVDALGRLERLQERSNEILNENVKATKDNATAIEEQGFKTREKFDNLTKIMAHSVIKIEDSTTEIKDSVGKIENSVERIDSAVSNIKDSADRIEVSVVEVRDSTVRIESAVADTATFLRDASIQASKDRLALSSAIETSSKDARVIGYIGIGVGSVGVVLACISLVQTFGWFSGSASVGEVSSGVESGAAPVSASAVEVPEL